MENLKFGVPVFAPGVNVTVRDGLKWDMLVDQLPKSVPVANVDDEVIGQAKVIGKMVIPFQSIPEEILALEHDPSARSYDGLKLAMEAAYGHAWDSTGQVVVLFFVFRQSE